MNLPGCNPLWNEGIHLCQRRGGRIRQSRTGGFPGTIDFVQGRPNVISPGITRRNGPNNLRRIGTSRSRYWLHALIVGLALTGEIHLFSVEVLHHHSIVASLCRVARGGGAHLHASQDVAPLCPLCQIVRGSFVRPVVQTLIQKPHLETPYRLISRDAKYSYRFSLTLPARSPPLP